MKLTKEEWKSMVLSWTAENHKFVLEYDVLEQDIAFIKWLLDR